MLGACLRTPSLFLARRKTLGPPLRTLGRGRRSLIQILDRFGLGRCDVLDLAPALAWRAIPVGM